MSDTEQVVSLTSELVKFSSVSGQETEVLNFLSEYFQKKNWNFEKIKDEADERYCILVSFGKPEIIFSTHIDVVPAKLEQFQPFVRDKVLYGRGTCDAKGILATMIAVCHNLLESNQDNFGLLVVYDEETGGAGARLAAKALKGRGVKYIINGEPTENKLAVGHKGLLSFNVSFSGQNAHSGYPELGDDANAKLIKVANRLLDTNFGHNTMLGSATLNLGKICGGSASNIVSDNAEISGMLRVVNSAEEAKAKVEKAVGNAGKVNFIICRDPVDLVTVPGINTYRAAYFTDIPYLMEIGAEALMYGPGSIECAHTDNEYLSFQDIEHALADYEKIFRYLKNE